MPFSIALIGNPNCGKTTLFNAVTGSSQYVGNWPGVTVEKKEGRFRHNGLEVVMVDLPGIYSLSPYTPEEIVSRQYVIEDKPDLIINIVDATNLERNLYLTTQLAELGRPMIIALNMIDMLKSRGVELDAAALEQNLGIPVCPISAAKQKGVDELVHRAMHMLHDVSHREADADTGTLRSRAFELHRQLHALHSDFHECGGDYYPIVKSFYDWKVSSAIEAIEQLLCDNGFSGPELRFHAVKLFENDPLTQKEMRLDAKTTARLNEILESVPETQLVDRQMIVADQRYRFICKICAQVVTKPEKPLVSLSEKIDRVMTHRIFAIPIFLGIMLLIFTVTFGPFGSLLTDGVDRFISETVGEGLRHLLTGWGVTGWAISLLCDGMLAGVGAVLSFLPQIALLFFFLSLLEDSGYMARAAFIMDRPLRKIGLTGRSFMPLLMGFGCTVPAVMGTRILENERDKKATVLLVPFMSCSAKMPVYALFISAFFARNKPLIIFSLYILGILMAMLCGFLFKKTILKGDNATFVMELPEYRFPTAKGLFIHIWERVKDFLVKAGTVLLAASVVIWFLQSFGTDLRMTDDSSGSILARLGGWLAPVFAPLGFGSWQAAVALLSGVVAKESVVSALEILMPTIAGGTLAGLFQSPVAAFAFLIFVLFYTPCIAAVSAIHRELHSARWTAFCVIFQISVAWVMSFLTYHIGCLIFGG